MSGWRSPGRRVGAALLLVALAGAPRAADAPPAFDDDFSAYRVGGCLKDGARFGTWSLVFAGYGCVQVARGPEGRLLSLRAARSLAPEETHSVFVAGPGLAAPFSFRARLRTVARLRRGSPPNPWEVGWLVWDYADNAHFYYFVPRARGWELGKRDPSYPEGQRALASGASPRFPLRAWTRVEAAQDESGVVTVRVDGRLIVRFSDEERPYLAGRVGVYDEDSLVEIAEASARTAR